MSGGKSGWELGKAEGGWIWGVRLSSLPLPRQRMVYKGTNMALTPGPYLHAVDPARVPVLERVVGGR